MLATLDTTGYAIVPAVLDSPEVSALVDALACLAGGDEDTAVRNKGRGVYAVRNLLTLSPAVRRLTMTSAILRLVEAVLGPGTQVVRAILFDKTAGANWKVAWHQDLSIAVRERHDVLGFGPWSVKAEVPHVQPPADVLRRMLTVRLHLDDCGPENGALHVLPGSHRDGVLTPTEVEGWRRRTSPVACVVPAGGALLMRPLLLHASSAAVVPGHRRVVHLEWSADRLPKPLDWYESIRPPEGYDEAYVAPHDRNLDRHRERRPPVRHPRRPVP